MKKLNVLLVDDEIMIREGFKRLFDWESHGCQVAGEAVDGMEALAKIDSLKPDIVVMDINIPIMNGLKVIELSRIKHPDTAYIIVSGYDDFSYCRQALRLQITDYILKPVNYEEFGACIDSLKISMFEQKVSSEEPVSQGERTIAGITRFLQEHLEEDLSLAVLSEEFHMNAQYISQLFKNEIGVNFLAYLTGIRMERAKNSCFQLLCPLQRYLKNRDMEITVYLRKCLRKQKELRHRSTGVISWSQRKYQDKQHERGICNE